MREPLVPFIARYRKEVTGNLDEVQIRDVQEKLEYFRELEDRRETVLQSIQEQGKLTPELKAKIEANLRAKIRAPSKILYLPYKPKHGPRHPSQARLRTRTARPVSMGTSSRKAAPSPTSPLPLPSVRRRESVLQPKHWKARGHIAAEWISENAEFRKSVRGMMMAEGVVASRAIEGAQDPEGKFQMYAQYKELRQQDSSHRMLPAIRRGAKEGVLDFETEL